MSNLAIDYMHTKRFCLPKSMAGCAKMHVGQVERAVQDRNESGDVTRLLRSWADGDTESLNAVIPIVYEELRRIASREMSRGAPGNHLQTTVLVHEAYEKLVSASRPDLQDRRHFFAVAARAIRQIVIDTYRSAMTAKRGAGLDIDLELQTGDLPVNDSPEKVMELSQAIDRLSADNAELAEILELSCFAGLSNAEIAELHETTVRTVQRKLLRAKAWVHHLLSE
jgi:RNA polymerase sigma factor (TIGR02999 family)